MKIEYPKHLLVVGTWEKVLALHAHTYAIQKLFQSQLPMAANPLPTHIPISSISVTNAEQWTEKGPQARVHLYIPIYIYMYTYWIESERTTK